jgi:hypothetical protein
VGAPKWVFIKSKIENSLAKCKPVVTSSRVGLQAKLFHLTLENMWEGDSIYALEVETLVYIVILTLK